MSDKVPIRFTLALVVLFCLLYCMDRACATNAALKKSDFAFAIACAYNKPERLCLVGRFKSNIKVTLLQLKGGVCSALTTSHGEELDSSGAYITALTDSCEFQKEFTVGVLKKPVKDYGRLILKETVDTATVSKITQLIRDSKALLALRTEAQDLMPGEMKELESYRLRIYQVPLPVRNILIASFERPNDNFVLYGPRVLVIGDHVYPLTGWCSYPTLNVFRLEGRHYIQSGSYCCNCGITIMQLFRITPEGPVEVVSDGSLSD